MNVLRDGGIDKGTDQHGKQRELIIKHRTLDDTGAEPAEAAFAALAAERLDESYRLARLILRDGQEAQDATHDAFVAAWRKRTTLRDPHRVDAWFGRILVNACRQRLRAQARRPTSLLPDEPAVPTADPYRPSEDRDEIEGAFRTLNPDQRIAVVLRFYRDLPVDEVARLVGAPSGTVKSRLHHAMRQLRSALQTDGPEVHR
ncbi:MAG TPA: RNA polymerase sigma factor [Methylomirabilota bacterium]|nr:RNA polymerase sigma factor [Methylomirabilota bacterium]